MICDEIKHRRHELGLTQAELAQLSGVAQSRISEFESGGRKPTFAQMEALASVLGPLTIAATRRPTAHYLELLESTGSVNVRLAADIIFSMGDGRTHEQIHRALLAEYDEVLTRDEVLAILAASND